MTQDPETPITRRSPEIWEAARHDYAAGASTAVIGERYGLAPRSVRRRAMLEQWPRDDAPVSTFDALRQRVESDLEAFPELADVGAVSGEDLRNLLLLPDALSLSRYAFRRAAESAALDGPNETAAWLRVVRLSQMVRDRIDVDVRPWGPGDYLRAAMIRSASDPRSSAESAESAMSPEIERGADSDG